MDRITSPTAAKSVINVNTFLSSDQEEHRYSFRVLTCVSTLMMLNREPLKNTCQCLNWETYVRLWRSCSVWDYYLCSCMYIHIYAFAFVVLNWCSGSELIKVCTLMTLLATGGLVILTKSIHTYLRLWRCCTQLMLLFVWTEKRMYVY